MENVPFISAGISFFVVFISTPWLIRYLNRIKLVVKDMNKEGKPLVPISGGVAVMAGLFVGLMSFIFFRTFFPSDTSRLLMTGENLTILFSATASILLISFVGFLDDLVIKGNHESSFGLRQWQKPLLTLGAAVPLVVINAGASTMALPFIGRIDIGLLYPLLIVPIGVVGAANMVNLLGGFNGMETGMGIVYTGMLGVYAFVNGRYIAALLALLTFMSLLAFYYYNRYPARVLPGDSLTYLLGAVIASIAIIGDIERAALIAAIPFIIELILKARSKLKAKSYGYYKDGKVYSLHDKKIYSIPHIFTRTGKFTEKQITYFMILIELVFASLIWLV
jgi:UDP-N-acetylglucosamine--dolichyl-phosphate N-acetylglucosaminephosphotransferase